MGYTDLHTVQISTDSTPIFAKLILEATGLEICHSPGPSRRVRVLEPAGPRVIGRGPACLIGRVGQRREGRLRRIIEARRPGAMRESAPPPHHIAQPSRSRRQAQS